MTPERKQTLRTIVNGAPGLPSKYGKMAVQELLDALDQAEQTILHQDGEAITREARIAKLEAALHRIEAGDEMIGVRAIAREALKP